MKNTNLKNRKIKIQNNTGKTDKKRQQKTQKHKDTRQRGGREGEAERTRKRGRERERERERRTDQPARTTLWGFCVSVIGRADKAGRL